MGHAIRHAFGASALLCATTAAAVQAAPIVNWSHAFQLEATGGLTDPVVLIGFDPQPDPPVRITTVDLRESTAPRLVIPGQSNPQIFTLFLALYGGPDTLSMEFDLPPLTGADLSSYLFRATGDGSVHDIRLTFSTSTAGIIDGTSLVGFNPQPDPPGDFGAFDVMGLEFGFTSLSDATVTLSITDEAGAPVSFAAVPAAVPEPATLSLVGLGVVGLGWARRRRRLRETLAAGPERRAMPHAIGHSLGIVPRFIAVLVACAAMPARADIISMNSAFALPAAAGEQGVLSSAVFSVPQFNPALGTLEGISYQVARGPLNFSWSVDQEGTCCGILTQPEPVLRTSLHYLGGTLETKFEDLPWSGPYPVVGPDSDGAPDFTGSDAHTFLGTFPLTTLAAPITDPFLFSVFTGSGAVPLELRTQLQLTSGQPGPGIFAYDSLISASAAQWFFAYEYTPAVIVDPGPGPGPSPVPEPTSLSLVGFSALALALRRRCRVRNAGGAAVSEG